MYYNVRVKTFPDGTKQYFYSENVKQRDYEVEERNITGENCERKKRENASRAKQVVYDLARANHFDWFITMTFDQQKVDRYDYDQCAHAIKCFTKMLCKNGNSWIIVPEQHKDGAYHFHGLVSGDLDLTYHGGGVYNLNKFNYGFTTASRIKDGQKIASYVAKYMSKQFTAPKGRKSYWASRSLQRPVEEYEVMTLEEFGEIFNGCRYQKQIDSPYGKYLLAET